MQSVQVFIWVNNFYLFILQNKEKEELKKEKRVICGYPLSIFFIVVNEFCERFSYYGMRAVLVLYFKYFLNWNDDFATSIYHVFVALCYLTPILGAIVADSWLGKFKTIIYLSIVYALGQIAMAISAVHDITDQNRDGTPDNMTFHVVLSMVGLFLIALGTGGIKPCVAAFGGDQFTNEQENQRRTFFSVFYLCINGGSLLSTIITPILRAQQCGIHTKMECYPLAFGVPAALMVVALVVFIVGSPMYFKAKPQGNIMLDVCKCIGFAIKNRYKHRSKQYPKREHWMDWAEEKYGKLLIAQIKMVLKVLFLYLPLPMFWTLFDQKGVFIVQPDQMQTFNPILILTLVPIMDNIIYPLIKKCGFNFSPLKRMTVGMFLAAMAFVCAAVVQLQIDKTLPTFPSSSQSQIKLLNMAPNVISVQIQGNNEEQLLPNQVCYFIEFEVTEPLLASNYSLLKNGKQTFTIRSNSASCTVEKEFGFGSSYTYFIPSTFTFSTDCGGEITEVEEIKPNTVHMALQIPQYFFITAGEVMFSVTGLEFSYSQAPSNMKAVLQAGWLLTVAVGNFIVLIVAELAKLPKQWTEYVLFASLLVAVCFIFSIMAYFYTYIDPAEIEAQFTNEVKHDDDDDDEDKPRKNSQKSEMEMVKQKDGHNYKLQTKL
uniref:Solute carrier family 15 member 1 n=1 Tax=Periophthalmus magnuspinnatus TaxID=409849 RepID=A0A3B4ABV9_9GOBI